MRVTCNCIEPDNDTINGYLFQKNYYWTIEGIWNKNFKATGKFYITSLMDMNFSKLYKPKNFILMYRKTPLSKWTQIKSESNTDYLEAELRTGQYAIAVKTYE